jgi:HPt (histidine-containing phosphotransfer) domain-containing protein
MINSFNGYSHASHSEFSAGQHSANADRCIDWEHLQQIADYNPDFELELLQLFLVDSHTHLQDLEMAIAQQDIPSIEQAAHHLKGASASVGAESIRSLATQLEEQARAGHMHFPEASLQQLNQALQGFREAIRQQYDCIIEHNSIRPKS